MHFLIKVSKFVSCSFAKFHFSVVPLLLLASLILLGKQKKKRNMLKKNYSSFGICNARKEATILNLSQRSCVSSHTVQSSVIP